MCWTSPGCRSGWCRRTATERKTAASAYAKEHGFRVVGAEEKITENRGVYGKNDGSAPAVLTGNPRRRIRIHSPPMGANVRIRSR